MNVEENQTRFNMRKLEIEIRRMITGAIQEQIRNPNNVRNRVINQDEEIDPQHKAQQNGLDRAPAKSVVLRNLQDNQENIVPRGSLLSEF